MDTKQFIAEHLDPNGTAPDWLDGEEFADTILENADGELPVDRNALIAYWEDAVREEDRALMEDEVKMVRVEHGPRGNTVSVFVDLEGFTMADTLTPKLARAACRIAGVPTGEVWEIPRPDPVTGERNYDGVIGYRVYAKSARKLSA